MINLSIDPRGSVGLITLEGKITIQAAGELKATLLKALSATDRIYIKGDTVSEADISCLQVLCSAHRAATMMKKRLAWAGRLPEIFRKAALDAGYVRGNGCSFDINKNCLWMRIGDD
ncbi:MAG: STAS domain-containing protein [Thermodesulfovibrionales bacterium]|jgi:anti-anti-sigma regulatory factor